MRIPEAHFFDPFPELSLKKSGPGKLWVKKFGPTMFLVIFLSNWIILRKDILPPNWLDPYILKAKKFAESAFQSQKNLRKKCVNQDIKISRQKCVNQ